MDIKRRAYKQGIVNTDTHLILKRGQVVSIISETSDVYLVQSFLTNSPEFIKKEYLKVSQE